MLDCSGECIENPDRTPLVSILSPGEPNPRDIKMPTLPDVVGVHIFPCHHGVYVGSDMHQTEKDEVRSDHLL